MRWITDEVMHDIQQRPPGQTYVDGYGTSVKNGSLSAADAVGAAASRLRCHAAADTLQRTILTMLQPIPSLAELAPPGRSPGPPSMPMRMRWRSLPSCDTRPPLVFAGECDNLEKLADVAAAQRPFLLQGGDCAETLRVGDRSEASAASCGSC